jgi:hypothetical protein
VIDRDVLVTRISTAEEYLIAYEKLSQESWLGLYVRYSNGELTLPQSFVLVHPQYYEDVEQKNGVQIRGKRQFEPDVSRYSLSCMAAEVLLTECLLNTYEMVESDHLFPYSLGGPTLPENQIFLCPSHNLMKLAGIHLFRWEQGEPGWLDPAIKRIYRLLSP